MTRWARWLEERLPAASAWRVATLVLCRTRHTVALVRRFVAERGGACGLEVTTPQGLALQLRLRGLDPGADVHPGMGAAEPLPDACPVAEKVALRPGLTNTIARHADAVRLAMAAGEDLSRVPSWLVDLAQTDWRRTEEEAALVRLLERAKARGSMLSHTHAYRRVVFLGYELDALEIPPWERALVSALGGRVGLAGDGANRSRLTDGRRHALPARRVPSATAESRAAVEHVLADPDGALVLYGLETTGARVAEALERNGIASAYDPGGARSVHPLARAATLACSWFSGDPDPVVRSADLVAVCDLLGLPGRLPDVAADWTERKVGRRARLASRDDLMAVVSSAGILRARLSTWSDVVGRSADVSGVALAARLTVLACCVGGKPLALAFGGPSPDTCGDAPRDALGGTSRLADFDAAVAELLGEDVFSGPEPAPGTIGALRRFLLCFSRIDRDDSTGRSVLATLRDARHEAAHPASVRSLMGGWADRGVIRRGVPILPLDSWDGRPATRLAILDVHDRGLGHMPPPDPFLDALALAQLGVPCGLEAVRMRLDRVRRAASAAHAPLCIVAAEDARGRAVVAPPDLQLDGRAAPPPSLPEDRPLAVPRADAIPALPPGTGSTLNRHVSRQATAEWIREGRGGLEPNERPRELAALDERLDKASAVPKWVAPWLGDASSEPMAVLPPGPMSASRVFGPLTQCMFRAFASVVLRVEEREELSVDPTPLDLGTLVHGALQGAAAVLEPRPPSDRVDEARRRAVEELRRHTESVFRDWARERSGLSPSRRAALEGEERRWKAHWEAWVAGRIRKHVPRDLARDSIDRHPLVQRLLVELRSAGPSGPPVKDWILREWLIAASEKSAEDLSRLDDAALVGLGVASIPLEWASALRQVAGNPRLADLCTAVQRLNYHEGVLRGPTDGVVAELPMGLEEADSAPWTLGGSVVAELNLGLVSVELGAETVEVRGKIDLVRRFASGGPPVLEILDYKSGRGAGAVWVERDDLASLRKSQLWVYALALRAAQRQGALPPELCNAHIGALSYDHVKHVLKQGEETWNARNDEAEDRLTLLVEDRQLSAIAHWLGRLVARARRGDWPLHPQPKACPRVATWSAPCPFADACRLRGER